jgi:N6-adenosine-specific RNA methylase IME4
MYKTIVADPPWPEVGGGKIKRGADRHYPLMKVPEITKLMKETLEGKVDDNAHLYLWVTNNHLKDGLEVMDALGFRYVTCITWMKNSMGLGQYYRGKTEHCLFGVKGMVPYRFIDGKRAQGVTGFYADKQEHSRKPIEMYQMIEKVSSPPFFEMFARDARDGWDVFGNEV